MRVKTKRNKYSRFKIGFFFHRQAIDHFGYLVTVLVIFFFQVKESLPSILSLQADSKKVFRGGNKNVDEPDLLYLLSFRIFDSKECWSISMTQHYQAKTTKKWISTLYSNNFSGSIIISYCAKRQSSAHIMESSSTQKAETKKR